MRTLLLWMSLSCAVVTLGVIDAHAAEVSPTDELVVSLDAEVEAMHRLVAVLKHESRDGRLDLSMDAKLSWQRADRAFEELVGWGREGDWRRAYKYAPTARAMAEVGAREAFSIQSSRAMKKAFRDYLDAVELRVRAVRRHAMTDGGQSDLLRWQQAQRTFEVAKEMAATGRHNGAWTTMANAVAMLDILTYELVFDDADLAANGR